MNTPAQYSQGEMSVWVLLFLKDFDGKTFVLLQGQQKFGIARSDVVQCAADSKAGELKWVLKDLNHTSTMELLSMAVSLASPGGGHVGSFLSFF